MIKETKDYVLVVASSDSLPYGLCYQIINRDTNVVEIETTLLPQALKHITELQVALDHERYADLPEVPFRA
jgi:hypothetical protein